MPSLRLLFSLFRNPKFAGKISLLSYKNFEFTMPPGRTVWWTILF